MGVVYETLDLERGDKIAMKTLLRSDGDAFMELAKLLARRRVAELESDVSAHAAAEEGLRALGVVAPEKVDRLFALA